MNLTGHKLTCLYLILSAKQVLQWGYPSKVFCNYVINHNIISIMKRFIWPTVSQGTCACVISCAVCVCIKLSHQAPAGLLHPWHPSVTHCYALSLVCLHASKACLPHSRGQSGKYFLANLWCSWCIYEIINMRFIKLLVPLLFGLSSLQL